MLNENEHDNVFCRNTPADDLSDFSIFSKKYTGVIHARRNDEN